MSAKPVQQEKTTTVIPASKRSSVSSVKGWTNLNSPAEKVLLTHYKCLPDYCNNGFLYFHILQLHDAISFF